MFSHLSIYLHKILPIFLLPTGITLLLILAGVLFRRRWVMWIALVFLWVCSTPIFSNLAIRSAEGWAERDLAINSQKADVIVVLSSGRVLAPGAAKVSEWGDPDRFYGGIELFKAGKAPLLFFTGGWSPWEPEAQLEGKILTRYAIEAGISEKNILVTASVVNTAEEANAVMALLNQNQMITKEIDGKRSSASLKVLLVTSAFHMARAEKLFEQAGFQVVPFPVDFKVSAGNELTLLSFLPSANALSQTEMAWREFYGRLYYWLLRLS
jgi:uncharacterized SAM-binding protein YcdF (DUF218 family)